MLKNISEKVIMLMLSSGQAVRISPGESIKTDAADIESPVVKELLKSGEIQIVD